ncbi:peptidylprolyl isomerase [Aestuariivita sp.]|jgi:peptidyl-prolyl cis-trans isomerase C|uniref:peptidylprolyl isomerase n=1 Tax=Aestuariivita sp. TaxID=1872407 RepID=UPI00216BFF45|nr:peptidylprolyl isomerase [Aestuariivita sp.]MCE8005466.1 peptidylprolyl isomerase [Aestuariivita sp.]
MRKGLTFVMALALTGALALPTQAQDTPSPETVVATVNGQDITLGHMIIAFTTLPAQYQQLPPDLLFGGILDQLIRQSALAQSFEGEPSLAARLSLENEERSLMAGEAVEAVMANAVDDAAIQALYNERYANGVGGEEYNASHILLETEEDALAAIAEIEGGAEFEDVARESSTGPSGPGGGSLGWFGPGQMVPDFEAAVIALEPGTISAPVQTQFGWHVILLNETRIQNAPPLEEVRAEISQELRQSAVEAHIEELVDAADIATPDVSTIDPATISNLDLLRN